ncbi:MAG: hypothetical protein ACXW5U_21725 [Thermoanaerobaculia bacterium]
MSDASDPSAPSPDPDPVEMMEQARSLIQSVKGFVHLTPSWRRKINSAATLPRHFYRIGAIVLDEHEWLAKAARVTGPEVRDAVDGSVGLVSLASELELLAKGLRSTAAARLGHVGQRLLLVYTVARKHNRNNDDVQIPQIAQMEAILRARRRRGRGKADPPAPEDSPAQADGELPES